MTSHFDDDSRLILRVRHKKNSNVIPFRSMRRPARRATTARRVVHREQLVSAQVLSFTLDRCHQRRPMVGRDAFPLAPLEGLPMSHPDIFRHRGNGLPAGKKVAQGFHEALIARDELSPQGGLILPTTAEARRRTMCPMGRGRSPAKFNKDLAERTKSGRIAAGYSNLKEFAALLGVDFERYKKWESGRTPIAHEFVQRYCELTGKDANYLFGTAQEQRLQRTG